MINADTIATMKNGVRIINLARADLVNNADIKAAIADGKVAKYVTDFPTEETVGVEGIVAIPHLGASTAESEDNCAVMAALQLDDFLRNGNIKNSVNFANVSMACSGEARICVLSAATDTLVADITAAAGVAIVGIASKARGENAYTIIDVNGDADAAVANIAALESVYRAYKI
jgi:D-3-phosphoglycerate dehydrogenase